MQTGVLSGLARHGKPSSAVGQRGRLRSLRLAAFVAVLVALRKYGPSLLRRIVTAAFGLAPPKPGAITRIGGLRVPSPGAGVFLSTVVYRREGPAPTMVIRTPYSKTVIELCAYAFAAQGFNVVLQDCRGRFDSTGKQTFGAFEDVDGVATINWLGRQGFDWYDASRVVMFGISYLGIVQWALIAGLARRSSSPKEDGCEEEPAAGFRLAAIAPLFSATKIHQVFFQGNAFALDFYMRYAYLMIHMNSLKSYLLSTFRMVKFEIIFQRSLRQCLGVHAMHKALDLPVQFSYNPRPQSKFWQNRDYSDAIAVAPPTFLATGWHDIFLMPTLLDYEAVVNIHGPGHARLLIGPWTHLESIHLMPFRTLLRASVDFLGQQVGLTMDGDMNDQMPVRLFIMGKRAGQGRWCNFSAWPPREVGEELMVLGRRSLRSHDPGCLAELSNGHSDVSSADEESVFVYDPWDPAPWHGGSVFNPLLAGEKEQGALVERGDVVYFETEPLAEPTVIIGRARLQLYLRSSRPHFDVYARLLDVHPSGRVYNVCDAALRKEGPIHRNRSEIVPEARRALVEEAVEATVQLDFSATAKTFEAGHRIRLLITGSAYPQFARHFGDTEQAVWNDPLAVKPCTVKVQHYARFPSALWLPVLGTATARSRSKSLAAASPLAADAKRTACRDADARMRKVQSEVACVKNRSSSPWAM